MPFDEQFKHHLHEVMIAASLEVQDEVERHKRELLTKARKTKNAAALPIAYSDAAIYAFKTRVQHIIDGYLQAFDDCGVAITADTEREVLKMSSVLTSAVHPLSFPPGLQGSHLIAVQQAYVQEAKRVGSQLQRGAANRLRAAKLRNEQFASSAATVKVDAPVAPQVNIVSARATGQTFISYAWESPEHKQWVLEFATALRLNAVDVILDEWDLPPGEDMYQFMERSVTEAAFVVIVCTPTYTAKANARVGGVGYEARIITTELAHQTEQRKFIPVLRSGQFPGDAPLWLASRRGLDFRSTPYPPKEFELLLRTLHREELGHPPLGPKPTFQVSEIPTLSDSEVSSGVISKPIVTDSALSTITVPSTSDGKQSFGIRVRAGRRAFQRALNHFGVAADRVSFVKTIDASGNSIGRYSVVNLRALHGEIRELNWRYRNSTGCVGVPVVESGGSVGVGWTSDTKPTPKVFEDVLRNIGTTRGKFVFDPPLRAGEPRSFQWSIRILNGDALTRWESRSLSTLEERAHIAGKPLPDEASGFFSQLVWYPTRGLSIGLRFPFVLTFPFESRIDSLVRSVSGELPVDEVRRGSSLWAYPPRDEHPAREEPRWDRDINIHRPEVVKPEDPNFAELIVKYPAVGDYHSLEWRLPELLLGPRNESLKSEAEDVRRKLLARRQRVISNRKVQQPDQVSNLLQQVHLAARRITGANDPSFSTAFLTWDRIDKRIVTISVCRNDGTMTQADRVFWLPFGLGLAGICFRRALDVITYNRDSDEGDPEKSATYLPVPGSPHHEHLLAISIDHPDWTKEIAQELNASRSRQVIGILTLGSYSSGSALGRYCGRYVRPDEMRELLDTCRQGVNTITNLLLSEGGLK